MPKGLRFFGVLILHTAVALIGTAFLESTLGRAFHPHSLAAILWKEWILSLLCAGFIGFFMWRTWKGSPAMWVWILPPSGLLSGSYQLFLRARASWPVRASGVSFLAPSATLDFVR